ncbi:response regulator transcription factor [Streptomyces sp. NPDC001970]
MLRARSVAGAVERSHGSPQPACPHASWGRPGRSARTAQACGSYAQTARNMGLSTHTVDAYLRRIRAKLGITSTAELTRVAISLGL